MSKRKRFYELKEKNLSKIMSKTIITKFFNMIKHVTRHNCANVMKTTNAYFESEITRLKKMIKKLKRVIEKTKNTIERNI